MCPEQLKRLLDEVAEKLFDEGAEKLSGRRYGAAV